MTRVTLGSLVQTGGEPVFRSVVRSHLSIAKPLKRLLLPPKKDQQGEAYAIVCFQVRVVGGKWEKHENDTIEIRESTEVSVVGDLGSAPPDGKSR